DEEEDDPFGGGSIIADEPPEVEPLRPPTTLPPVSEEPSETGTPDSFADQPTSPRSASAPKVPLAEASPDPGPELSREALDSIFTQLGIPTDLDDEARARLAEEIGATFAAMADAMRQMLATRAEVKRALGIVATEVEIGANPLKTARDRTAAIDGLVRPLSSGFLSGEAAVEDSLHSMQAHQYAMVSGIKAALQKTLDAFDPKTLEEKLTERGWSSWLPGQRKAALWDSFVGNYQMFSEQAADNFRMLIGRELDNLYQTRRDQPPGWPDDKP
ncbi:MAG: type VI secretion system-associated FHA domain protein TagH, partial [Paracoccaceae bacterium]